MMKSTEITISSSGNGVNEILKATESFAAANNLTGKNAIRLSLMAEETVSMLRAITGEVQATFWLENEDGVYRIHLRSLTNMTASKRKQLMSASTSGQNIAAKGFLGTLQSVFERFTESYMDKGVPEYYTSGLVLTKKSGTSSSDDPDPNAEVINWSMNQYKNKLLSKKSKDQSAGEAWDELEKSILANVADEVNVGIAGGVVELIITKKF